MIYGVVIDGITARYIGIAVKIERELNDGYFVLCEGQFCKCIDKTSVRIITKEEYIELLPKTKAILRLLKTRELVMDITSLI